MSEEIEQLSEYQAGLTDGEFLSYCAGIITGLSGNRSKVADPLTNRLQEIAARLIYEESNGLQL